MKIDKEKRVIQRTRNIILLIVIIIVFCIVSGELILKRMEGYIEKNGTNNMATVMEQMTQSYDIQVDAYYRRLGQIEQLLFQDGKRAISLKKYQKIFDSIQPDNTEQLLFMKVNGETLSTDGKKSHVDIQNQMLIDLNKNKKIAQSVTMNINNEKENYYLIAIPCKPYTVDGETYNVIATLYDPSKIDSILELNGYGGEAYIFLVDENGIVNYTNQLDDTFYRNYSLIKHLWKDKAISDEQYDTLIHTMKTGKEEATLYDQNDRPFYLGCYPVKSSDHRLICIVSKTQINNSLLKYQKLMIRLLIIYALIVLFLCIGLIYNVFKLRASNKKVAYEEEKRQIQEKAMKELEAERKRADHANRAKSDFLSNMSHDIRTPMNAIVGLTELMAHESDISDRMKDYLDKIQSSSKHLLALINDVLDTSKIESGEVRLNKEKVNIIDILQQTESIIQAQTKKHGQTFEVHVDEIKHKDLICDGIRLRQILLNLLSNAVKYTPDGGTIRLNIAETSFSLQEKARFTFVVEDDGYGMDQEFIKHIFEPFSRAEQSVTNRVQGTGLGMTITKNIVDLMGGEIFVKSEPLKGSQFTVILDFKIDRDVKMITEDSDSIKSQDDLRKNLNGMKFLCAEDNELNAEILEELLWMYGATCTIYSDGEKIVNAFKNVKSGEYDAILMDVQMPKMNGLEATKAIRESENKLGKTIPIIAMTANAFSEDVGQCLKAGMDAHIAKPIDVAILEKTLHKVLQ